MASTYEGIVCSSGWQGKLEELELWQNTVLLPLNGSRGAWNRERSTAFPIKSMELLLNWGSQ